MTVQEIRSGLGEYAKDIKINLGTVLTEEGAPGLSENQIFGIALASAYTTKQKVLIEAVRADAEEVLSEAEVNAAKLAATLMGMTNVYYRFTHLVSDKEYAKMSAKLRMNAMANPGIEKVDFELYSLAVSAINGCGMCMDAHVAQVEKAGISREGVQSCIRIAAVLHAAAQAVVIG
ncbi:MAG: alkyl hydroperoxide reductase [Alphaproteobacteria bacterium]|nr:alkyl hydroperoxide reductase [Alphaproteobacteria bacterium]